MTQGTSPSVQQTIAARVTTCVGRVQAAAASSPSRPDSPAPTQGHTASRRPPTRQGQAQACPPHGAWPPRVGVQAGTFLVALGVSSPVPGPAEGTEAQQTLQRVPPAFEPWPAGAGVGPHWGVKQRSSKE